MGIESDANQVLRRLAERPRDLEKRWVKASELRPYFGQVHRVNEAVQGVDPLVVGKWVVFGERWPALQQRVYANPKVMQSWELKPEQVLSAETKAKSPMEAEQLEDFLRRKPVMAEHVAAFVKAKMSSAG